MTCASAMMAFAVLTGSLSGCSMAKAENSTSVQEQGIQENDEKKKEGNTENGQENQQIDSRNDGGNTEGNLIAEDGKLIVGDIEVSLEPEDEYTEWDEDSAAKIELSDHGISIEGKGASAEGSVLTITKGGTYVIQGELSDGKILVDADNDDVRLVFDGVNIHSESSAAVDVKKAGKTIISLESGSVNSLSDSANFSYRDNEKEEPNGTLFSKDDLTINGSGTLKVNAAFNNGICSKDTLKIVGGTYEIYAANNGIKGNDALVVYDGQLTVTATGDGVKSDTLAAVLGGNILIHDCEEGLEAETVLIGGGTIDLTARDDGINASTDGTNTPQIYFMDGTVTVRAEGDGIDSNGSISMSGGEVTVYGPSRRDNGALDYDREFVLTGGVLAAFGIGGMDQNVSSTDSQVSVLANFQETQAAGTVVTLRDEAGNELYKGAGEKDFQTVVISVPEMVIGKEYELLAGETVISFVPEETIIYVNKEGIQEAAAMGPGRGGPGNRGGRMNGEQQGQPGERPEPPEGWGNGERPEPPEGRENGERPEPPEGRENGEKPVPPEGWENGEKPEPPEGWENGERPESLEGRENGEKPEPPEGRGNGKRSEPLEGCESGEKPKPPKGQEGSESSEKPEEQRSE